VLKKRLFNILFFASAGGKWSDVTVTSPLWVCDRRVSNFEFLASIFQFRSSIFFIPIPKFFQPTPTPAVCQENNIDDSNDAVTGGFLRGAGVEETGA